MPFTLDPEIAAGMAEASPNGPPPGLPVGDVKGRRELLDQMLGSVFARAPSPPNVRTQDFKAKTEDGYEVALRWYSKSSGGSDAKPGSAVLYIHGGGMIALSIDVYDIPLKLYVEQTGVPMLAVDYRRAPEVKAPTPLLDCYEALEWLIAHASELGVDTNRIMVMGDSAGGGLAASLAHYVKGNKGPAIRKQILIYPMLDDRTTAIDPDTAPYLTWSVDDNRTGWGALLGDKAGGASMHTIAAGRMTVYEARNLPPVYMDVGQLDLFRDECVEYVRKLCLAGVDVTFHLIPGAPHAFEAFAPAAAVSGFVREQRIKAILSV